MTTQKPIADRPYMPGYGISTSPEGLLPWSWAEERLAATRNYWIGTVAPDGAPHSMPVWGIWLDGRLWFSTGANSRKARNIARDPRCTVTTERADEAVIVEGVVTVADPGTDRTTFNDAYNAKYDWDMSGDTGPIFIVAPRTVWGFIEHSDRFATAATRWRFGQ